MRILRIADVADNRTGGMSRAMYGTGDALTNLGVSVEYAFGEALSPRIAGRLRRFTVPQAIPSLVRQREASKSAPFDVVEIHEPLAAAYCIARRLDRRLPPIVIFSHGLEERGFAAELSYYREKGLSVSLKKRISPYSVVVQAMFAVRHADHVLCCSGEDYHYLKHVGVPEGHLTQHQNGVEEEFIAAASEGSASSIDDPERHFRLLFVGSWLVRKGTLDLAAALPVLFQQYPAATLTIAGSQIDSSTVLAAFDPSLWRRINIIPRFDPSKDLASLYRRHGTLVLPSYFEGQPLVMIEAAAMGLAIVTTDICGMRDFVRDGVEGLLIRPGDVVGLTAALSQLLGDNFTRRRLAAAARARAATYTWANAARTLMTAYATAAISRTR